MIFFDFFMPSYWPDFFKKIIRKSKDQISVALLINILFWIVVEWKLFFVRRSKFNISGRMLFFYIFFWRQYTVYRCACPSNRPVSNIQGQEKSRGKLCIQWCHDFKVQHQWIQWLKMTPTFWILGYIERSWRCVHISHGRILICNWRIANHTKGAWSRAPHQNLVNQ